MGEALGTGRTGQVLSLSIVLVLVPVLDFCGCEKRADYRQRSKIENEDEDDWRLHGTKHTVVAEGTPEEAPNRKYYLVF
jgi:hypothetical protein